MMMECDWGLIANFATALFAIVNPLGNLPLFLAVTADERPAVQRILCVYLSLAVLALLLIFFLAGEAILGFFGITLPAFRIAGGVLLMLTGISAVRGQEPRMVQEAKIRAEGDLVAQAKDSFRKIVIPLGMPLFVGPGAISTVILYSQLAEGATWFGLLFVLVGLAGVILLTLLAAPWIKRSLGQLVLDLVPRILGLLLTAMGVQFILAGLSDVLPGIFVLTPVKP